MSGLPAEEQFAEYRQVLATADVRLCVLPQRLAEA